MAEEINAKGAVIVADLTQGARQGFDPIKMLLRGGHEALEILQIATGAERAWLDSLDIAEGAKLFGAVYTVNSDFFHRNRSLMLYVLAPVLKDAAALVDVIVLKAAALL